ncbi:hypothetical protein QOT17_013784 [Balamuthia mandrillaris]
MMVLCPFISFYAPCLAQCKPHKLKALALVDNCPFTVKFTLNKHIKGKTVALIIKALKILSGFEYWFISAYHPCTNGIAESHVTLAHNILTSSLTKIGLTGTPFLLLPSMQSINTLLIITSLPLSNYSLVAQLLLYKTILFPPSSFLSKLSSWRMPSECMVCLADISIFYQNYSSNIKPQHNSSKPLHKFTAGSKVMLCKPPRSPKSLPEYSAIFDVIVLMQRIIDCVIKEFAFARVSKSQQQCVDIVYYVHKSQQEDSSKPLDDFYHYLNLKSIYVP